jgi:hypothetical protein
MASGLATLLGRLAGHARALDDTHSLDEFQRQAADVCGGCELTLQQLASARAALRATTPATWEGVADSGVVLGDVVKCAPGAGRGGGHGRGRACARGPRTARVRAARRAAQQGARTARRPRWSCPPRAHGPLTALAAAAAPPQDAQCADALRQGPAADHGGGALQLAAARPRVAGAWSGRRRGSGPRAPLPSAAAAVEVAFAAGTRAGAAYAPARCISNRRGGESSVCSADIVCRARCLGVIKPLLPPHNPCHSPQAHSILDGLTFSGFMQRVKDAACGVSRSAVALELQDDGEAGPSSGAPAPAAPADAPDDDTAACLGFEAVANLAAALGAVGLRSCDDVRQICAEALPELASGARTGKATAATRAAGLTPGEPGAGRGERRGGTSLLLRLHPQVSTAALPLERPPTRGRTLAASPLPAGNTRDAAYEAMSALLDPRHGSVHDIAAALFPRLSPILLGAAAPSGGRRGAADAAAARSAACTFVCDALG